MQTVEQQQSEILHLCPEQIQAMHLAESAKWICAGAEAVRGTRALVAGCGNCAEIPLEELGRSFNCIDLVDVDESALQTVHGRVDDDERLTESARIHNADLTGLIEPLRSEAVGIVRDAADPLQCLSELAELLDSSTPSFWRPADGGEYDFIVCSAVLTQIQATTRQAAEAAFLHRFDEFTFALNSHERWRRAAWQFARRLEDGFIAHLERLARSGGVIYLSDTVHVWWLVEQGPQTFESPGCWIATRSSVLREYLSPWTVVLGENAWPWMLQKEEGPYWGRLYGCQAVLYRAA